MHINFEDAEAQITLMLEECAFESAETLVRPPPAMQICARTTIAVSCPSR